MKRSFSSLQRSYDNMEDPTLAEPPTDSEYEKFMRDEFEDDNHGYSQEDLDKMAEDAMINDEVRKGIL